MSTRDDRAYHAALAERRQDEHNDAVAACGKAGSELFDLLDSAAHKADRTRAEWHEWCDDAATIRGITRRVEWFLKAEGLL